MYLCSSRAQALVPKETKKQLVALLNLFLEAIDVDLPPCRSPLSNFTVGKYLLKPSCPPMESKSTGFLWPSVHMSLPFNVRCRYQWCSSQTLIRLLDISVRFIWVWRSFSYGQCFISWSILLYSTNPHPSFTPCAKLSQEYSSAHWHGAALSRWAPSVYFDLIWPFSSLFMIYYLDNHATDNTLLLTTEWCLATIYQCQWQEQNCIQCFVLRMVARFLSKWASNQLSYIPRPSKFGGVHQRTPAYTSVHGITVAVTIMQGTSLTIMVCYCNLLNFVGFCWTSPDPSD